jgi:hypothetical protein
MPVVTVYTKSGVISDVEIPEGHAIEVHVFDQDTEVMRVYDEDNSCEEQQMIPLDDAKLQIEERTGCLPYGYVVISKLGLTRGEIFTTSFEEAKQQFLTIAQDGCGYVEDAESDDILVKS